jgi:hypothetical protein
LPFPHPKPQRHLSDTPHPCEIAQGFCKQHIQMDARISLCRCLFSSRRPTANLIGATAQLSGAQSLSEET